MAKKIALKDCHEDHYSECLFVFCASALSQSATAPYLSLSWVTLRPGLKCNILFFVHGILFHCECTILIPLFFSMQPQHEGISCINLLIWMWNEKLSQHLEHTLIHWLCWLDSSSVTNYIPPAKNSHCLWLFWELLAWILVWSLQPDSHFLMLMENCLKWLSISPWWKKSHWACWTDPE